MSRRTYVGARSGCCWWWPIVQGREKKRGERRRGSCAPHGPVVCWPVVITRRKADPSDCALGVLVKNNEVVIGARLFFSTVQCYVGFSFLGERHARWRIGIEEKRTAQFVGERESKREREREKERESVRQRGKRIARHRDRDSDRRRRRDSQRSEKER